MFICSSLDGYTYVFYRFWSFGSWKVFTLSTYFTLDLSTMFCYNSILHIQKIIANLIIFNAYYVNTNNINTRWTIPWVIRYSNFKCNDEVLFFNPCCHIGSIRILIWDNVLHYFHFLWRFPSFCAFDNLYLFWQLPILLTTQIIDNYMHILQNSQIYIHDRVKFKSVIGGLERCLCLLCSEEENTGYKVTIIP